jgi:2-haloacid dehalogenase
VPAPADRPVITAVFDLGNVCVVWDRRLLYRQLFADEAALEQFLSEVYTLEANEQFDRGQPLVDFTVQLAERWPTHAEAILALQHRWIETIGPVIDGTIALLGELHHAKVPLYALSNWNAETFALVEPRFAWLEWFSGVVVSGREGVIKPQPDIYHRLLDRYAIDPTTTVFVDDSPANVDTARSLGMRAIVFDSPEQLRGALVDLGLPVERMPREHRAGTP